MVSLAATLVLGLLAASGVPSNTVANTAARVVVKVDERRFVAAPDIESALVLEEGVARVSTTSGGLEIQGKRSGETLAQLYGPSGVRVLIVVVEPASLHKVISPNAPTPMMLSRQEPLKSFWGANSYTLDAQESSNLGILTNHSLRFSGLVHEGEYNSDVQVTAGALGTSLLRARLGWINAQKTSGFELGDAASLIYGSRLSSSLQFRGLKVRRGTDRSAQEIYLGGLTSYGTAGDQPVVGFNIEGESRPEKDQGLTVRHGASAMAFSSAEGLGDGGRVGVVTGERVQIEHTNGLSLEGRSAVTVSTPRADGQSTQTGLEGGLTAAYRQGEFRSASLSYDLNVGKVYMPLTRSTAPAAHQLAASYAQRVSPKVHAYSAASYLLLGDQPGESGRGLSYTVGAQALLTPQTRMTLQGGQTSSLYPIATTEGLQVASQVQRTVGLTTLHQFSAETLSQVQLAYENSQGGRGSRDSALGTVGLARQVSNKWEAGATAGVTAYQDSVIASDRPPLTVQANVAARGRLIMGSFESFGGLNIQKTVQGQGVAQGPGVSVNLGVQFAPTLAHRVATNFSLTRTGTNQQTLHSVSMSYTYRFGDAIRSDPLFEFMTHGEISGRVCVDEDINGQCEAREGSLAGITVRLSNGASTVTDALGRYRFKNLKPGFYGVEADETRLRALGRLTTPSTANLELASKGSAEAVFGVSQGCDLKGRVVNDLDLDGAYTPADTLIGGVTVKATGAEGSVESTVDSFGTFILHLAKCGDYVVEVNPGSLPAAMRVVTGTASARTTPNATPVVELMVAAIRTAEGTVFIDANRNGHKDPGEVPVGAARVLWGTGKAVTDDAGSFLMRRLPAGKLSITVDPESLPPSLIPGGRLELDLNALPQAVEGLELPVVTRPQPTM